MEKQPDYRKRFYYIRNTRNKPLMTICIVQEGLDFARGISFCSPQDHCNKKEGRKWAEKRALNAFKHKRILYPIRRTSILNFMAYMQDTNNVNLFKSIYNPMLTQFEEKLLGGQKSENNLS